MATRQKPKQKQAKVNRRVRPLARQLARKLPKQALEAERIGTGKQSPTKRGKHQDLNKLAEIMNDDSNNLSKEQIKLLVQTCKNAR